MHRPGARTPEPYGALGHSSIEVTLDRYGHLFPGLDAALTRGLEGTYQASLARPWR